MSWPDPATINWSEGLGSMFVYINTVSLGWVSRMFLIAIYVIVLSAYYKARDDFGGGLAVAGISIFSIGLVGWIIDPPFIDGITLAFATAIMFIGVAIVLLDQNKGTA